MEDIKLFYKYQRLDERNYAILNLKNHELHFNHPTKFNDPFDCKMNYIYHGRIEDWIKFIMKTGCDEEKAKEILSFQVSEGFLEKDGEHIILDPTNNKYRDQRNHLLHGDFHRKNLPLVTCFSELSTNILMWSHYADNHQGICLCFKTKTIKNEHIICLDSNLLIPVKGVEYSEDAPSVFNMFDSDRDSSISKFLLTKYSGWDYENEYRVLIDIDKFKPNNLTKYDDQTCRGMMNYDKKDLEGIIFGMKISLQNAKSVYDVVCKEYSDEGIDINLYQAKAIQGKYALQIEAINDINNYFDSLT